MREAWGFPSPIACCWSTEPGTGRCRLISLLASFSPAESRKLSTMTFQCSLSPLGQCVLTIARTDHLPNLLANCGPLMEPGGSGEVVSGRVQCSPEPSQALSRGRGHGTRMLPESRPSFTTGFRVHFCLCHLPSHLKGSHDGFIGFLICETSPLD